MPEHGDTPQFTVAIDPAFEDLPTVFQVEGTVTGRIRIHRPPLQALRPPWSDLLETARQRLHELGLRAYNRPNHASDWSAQLEMYRQASTFQDYEEEDTWYDKYDAFEDLAAKEVMAEQRIAKYDGTGKYWSASFKYLAVDEQKHWTGEEPSPYGKEYVVWNANASDSAFSMRFEGLFAIPSKQVTSHP